MIDWSRPTSVIEIKSFLELASFYRSFLLNFSGIAAPLTKLTRKDENFIWSVESKHNFQELNDRLMLVPVLALPLGSDRFMIYSNESHKGLGCVLMQNGKVIAYAL